MQKNLAFEEKEYSKVPLTEAEIRTLLGTHQPSEVFSTKSPTYRALGLGEQALSEDQMVQWMVKEPNLLRRPILKVGDRLIIGFDAKAYAAL